MALQEKTLGQLRPANTTAASLYSPGTDVTAIVKTVIICNTSASLAKFRLFLDDDGTTYDQTTALFYDADVNPLQTIELDTYFAMNNSAGNLAVRTDTADALTFTAFGAEVTP